MSLTSGDVAERAGVNKQTLRYYEDIGLIDEPPRDSSNYRQYPESTVRRLKFIGRAKELGFTLDEIDTLIDMTEGEAGSNEEVLEFAEEKLEDVKQRLEEYKKLERILSDLIEDCREGDSYEPCSLIETLTPESSANPHGDG